MKKSKRSRPVSNQLPRLTFGSILVLVAFLVMYSAWSARKAMEHVRSSSRVNSWQTFRDQLERVRRGDRSDIALYIAPDGDAKVQELLRISGVKSLYIENGDFTDDGMRSVAMLPSLTEFTYIGGAVTEKGIHYLRGNGNIRHMTLATRPLSSSVVSVFVSMCNLRSLTLFSVSRNQTELDSAHRGWVAALGQLRQLEELNVGSTYVAQTQIASLRKALPNTAIVKISHSPY